MNVPKMQEMVSQSPRVSLGLSMYSFDFNHKTEVIRNQLQVDDTSIVSRMQEMVSQSPRVSLGLSMYSFDFNHKTEAIRNQLQVDDTSIVSRMQEMESEFKIFVSVGGGGRVRGWGGEWVERTFRSVYNQRKVWPLQ